MISLLLFTCYSVYLRTLLTLLLLFYIPFAGIHTMVNLTLPCVVFPKLFLILSCCSNTSQKCCLCRCFLEDNKNKYCVWLSDQNPYFSTFAVTWDLHATFPWWSNSQVVKSHSYNHKASTLYTVLLQNVTEHLYKHWTIFKDCSCCQSRQTFMILLHLMKIIIVPLNIVFEIVSYNW